MSEVSTRRPGQRSRRRDGSAAKQVNPLKRQHGNKLAGLAKDWLVRAFGARAHLPLVVDVGTGSGEWVLEAARRFEDWNFLGLDVRGEALPAASPANAAFLCANSAEGDVASLLRQARQKCPVKFVLAQFPDPLWKRKHRRRAMVTPSLCRAVALANPAAFAVRSDVAHVVDDAKVSAAESPALLRPVKPCRELLNLLAIPTERQLYASRCRPDDPHLCVFGPEARCLAMSAVVAEVHLHGRQRRPQAVEIVDT